MGETMRNHTCHDAACIIKYETFLKKLKFFKVTLRIYPLESLDRPGIYYVLIQDEDQIEDMAFEVNVLKRRFEEVELEVTLEKIKKSDLIEYKIEVDRKKRINYGHD